MQSYSYEHGPLAFIALKSCRELGEKVNLHLNSMYGMPSPEHSFLVPINEPRFSNGEGKVELKASVRGKDVFILCDVGNYSCSYKMFGKDHIMGPDEHFQDIKRAISAIGGKANRVTVIMPLLYSSRQHRRQSRESLDCAMALQELERLGVSTIITFDAHDTNIQNAIPLISFESIYPTYTILKSFMQNEGTQIDKDNMIVISPDTGAMGRAIYYAGVLGLDVGMFYKRRDHSVVINGKNPIIQHEYLGRDLTGKRVLVVDDMLASGESVLDILVQLKKRGASSVFVVTSFAFFTEGIEKFNKYFEEGLLTKLYTTNLSYLSPEIRQAPWCVEVDVSKFIAKIITTLNHDCSLSSLLDAKERIKALLDAKSADGEIK